MDASSYFNVWDFKYFGWFLWNKGGEVGFNEFLLGQVGKLGNTHHFLSLPLVEFFDLSKVLLEDLKSVSIFNWSIFLIEFCLELCEFILDILWNTINWCIGVLL